MADGRLYRDELRVLRTPEPDGRLYRDELRVLRTPEPDGRLYRMELRVLREYVAPVTSVRARAFTYGG